MIGSGILLALNVLGALWLESSLTRYVKVEFAFIALLLLFAVVLISAEAQRFAWVWRAQVAYFAMSVLNIGLLFLATSKFWAFALGTIIGLIGLLRAVSRMECSKIIDEPHPVKLETYGPGQKPQKSEEPLYVEPVTWVKPENLLKDVDDVVASTAAPTAKSIKKLKSRTKSKSSRSKKSRK